MKVYWIDLFSGAGGTTTGIHLANNPDIQVVACVNHDANAIESHKANHPNCKHFIEDVRDYGVIMTLKKLVESLRKESPDCIINLWFSLECTNYSNAKGGLPRDGDSRTLAYSVYNYIDALNPDYVYIENVREFMAWGPLDENGRPVSTMKGIQYQGWISYIQSMGFDYEFRILDAADYGAYTSRKRYFGQFAKNKQSKTKPSFIESNNEFWFECTHMERFPVKWPKPTHSKDPNNGLLNCELKQHNPVKDVLDLEDHGESIFDTKPVENTEKRIYAGLIKFIAGGERSFNEQLNGRKKVAPSDTTFLFTYYGTGKNIHSIEKPSPTLTTKDRVGVIKPQFLISDYSNTSPSSLDEPNPTLTTVPKQNLASCYFLMNPQYSDKGRSIERPCFTLIARMDKKPPYLI